MRLCLEMGLGLDVDAVADSVSPEQLNEWIALDRIEPIGEPRRDLRTALSALNIIRAVKSWGAGSLDFDLTDFLPWRKDAEPPDPKREAVRRELAAHAEIERIRFRVGVYNAAYLNQVN